MENSFVRTLVNLDGLHSLEISVDKENKTVIAHLIVPDEAPTFIYAEKFDEPCNYMKTAIKKGIVYLRGEQSSEIGRPEINNIH
ncbi:MAG: hypothetical protein IJZ07_00060 [Clostridia bacterium]|nr:hypothetical protein [Clostridia bacterium]